MKKSIVPILIIILIVLNVIQYSKVRENELNMNNQSVILGELSTKLKQEESKNAVKQVEIESMFESSEMIKNENKELYVKIEKLNIQNENLLYYIKDYTEIMDYISNTYPEAKIDDDDEQEVLDFIKGVILGFSDDEMSELKFTEEGKPINYVNKDELSDFFKNSYVYHLSIDSSNIVAAEKEYLIKIDSAVLHKFNEFANISSDLPGLEPINKIMFCLVTIGEKDVKIRLSL